MLAHPHRLSARFLSTMSASTLSQPRCSRVTLVPPSMADERCRLISCLLSFLGTLDVLLEGEEQSTFIAGHYFFPWLWYISINSSTVVASVGFLSFSLNETSLGNRSAYPGSSPTFPAVWIGERVISSARTSITISGSSQTLGCMSDDTRAGL